MTIDELIMDVEDYLTMSGALPKVLPTKEIERIIENDAKPWFWENYSDALIKEYLLVPSSSFTIEPTTQYKYTQLPCNVEYIVWLYRLDDRSLYELGVSAPGLSVNIGLSQSPMVSSYLTTIGELGVYKVIIDSFSDMLNQLSKQTLKYDFNRASKQLHILTSMGTALYSSTVGSVVLEVYTHIPNEDLFDLNHFRRYVRAVAGMQLGRLYKRYTFKLPGGGQINADAVYTDAETELKEVREEIKAQNGNSGWFFMVKK